MRGMDDIDLQICKLLFNNSRRPQREIADIIGISVAAVHRRIDSLIEEGVIKEFGTNISIGYLGAINAQVDGVCDYRSINDAIPQLKKNGSVQSVLASAANLTTLTLLLHDISELGPTVEELRSILAMQDPKVTISSQVFVGDQPFDRGYTGKHELSNIDYRIINALHHNARKLVVDISEETGITQKTIKHHLEEMEKDGAIEHSLHWNPANSSGADFIIRIDLVPGTDKRKYISYLNKMFAARMILTFIHSNFVDYICGYCWAPTISKQNELVESIRADGQVLNVKSGIIQAEWDLETWRDSLLAERMALMRHP